MLRTISTLIDMPIMSLQTGTQLGVTTAAIVDPSKLMVVAFYASNLSSRSETYVLHPSDIREISELGFIVDSDTKLMPLDGLVRLQKIIDENFELIGLRTIDEDNRKLGRVANYGVETESYSVQQLYTEQSLIRSFFYTGHTIHRSQIINVTNTQIVVKSSRISKSIRQTTPENSVGVMNPFRKSSQTETSETSAAYSSVSDSSSADRISP